MTTLPITGAAFYYRWRDVKAIVGLGNHSVNAVFPDLPGFTVQAPNRHVLELTLAARLRDYLNELIKQGKPIPAQTLRGGPYSRVILRPTDAVIILLWQRYLALSEEAQSSWISWAARHSNKKERWVLNFFRLGHPHNAEQLFAYGNSLGFKYQMIASPIVA